MAQGKRRSYRSLLYVGLLVLFLIAVIVRWDEAVQISRVVVRCAPGLLILAILTQVGYYLTQAALYQTICRTVDLPYRYFQLLPLMVVWPFLNVVAPSTSVSAIALLADDARQRGMRPERAIVAAVTYIAFCYASLIMVVCAALVDLYQHGLLRPYQEWAAIVLGLGLAGLLAVLALAGWAPRLLVRFLDAMLRVLRWLARALHLPMRRPAGMSAATVENLHQSVREVVRYPGRLVLAGLWALLGQGAHLVGLYLIILALGQKVSNTIVLASYSISSAVTNVSPTPQGIGMTEGAMVTVLRSLGEPRDGAWAITLVYRGVTFWLSLLAGFILARSLRTFSSRARKEAQGAEPAESPLPSPPDPPAK